MITFIFAKNKKGIHMSFRFRNSIHIAPSIRADVNTNNIINKNSESTRPPEHRIKTNYAILDFANSANVANPSASFTAISASIFLFTSTPASFNPYMNLL